MLRNRTGYQSLYKVAGINRSAISHSGTRRLGCSVAVPEVRVWGWMQAEPDVLATTGSDRSIALYDLRSGKPIRKLIMQTRTNRVAWNPMEAFNFTGVPFFSCARPRARVAHRLAGH